MEVGGGGGGMNGEREDVVLVDDEWAPYSLSGAGSLTVLKVLSSVSLTPCSLCFASPLISTADISASRRS